MTPPFAFPRTGYKKPIAPPPPEKVTILTASVAIPPIYTTDVTPWKSPPTSNIFFQQQQPSCLADGVCQAMEYAIWKATGNVVNLSRRFLWALCVKNDGLPIEDGTYLNTALTMAEQYGVCEAQYFDDDTTLPLDVYADASQITQEAYTNALTHKVANWSLVGDISFAGLNRAIYQYGVVITCMEISDQWWTAPNGATSWAADDILPLRPSNPSNPIVSGHCVVLYAYDTLQHYLLNWWSAGWAYNGRGWYRANEAPAVYEAAVLSVVVPTQPAPVAPEMPTIPTVGLVDTVKGAIGAVIQDIETVIANVV